MAGHLGVDRVTTLNLKVRQTDVARGLILVEGAVPGVKGGWITVRDAVKKALPEGVPKPGKFKLIDAAPTAPAASAPASQAEAPQAAAPQAAAVAQEAAAKPAAPKADAPKPAAKKPKKGG
jgi:hypothetical protein